MVLRRENDEMAEALAELHEAATTGAKHGSPIAVTCAHLHGIDLIRALVPWLGPKPGAGGQWLHKWFSEHCLAAYCLLYALIRWKRSQGEHVDTTGTGLRRI